MRKIFRSQRGQGVWEYMIALIGAGAVAFAVIMALKSGLIGGSEGSGGTVDKVTGKVDSLIDATTKDVPTGD